MWNKAIYRLVIGLSWVILALLAAISVTKAARPEYAIIIVLDGFRNDYIDLYDTPTLRQLAGEGVRYEQANGVFPSNSTVNQTSLVTGAYPKTTGIPNNSRFDRATDRILSPLRDNRATTIAQVFQGSGLRTASVGHYMLEHHVHSYTRNLGQGLLWLRGELPPHLFVYLNLEIDSSGHASSPFSPQTRQAVEQADREVRALIDTLKSQRIYEQSIVVVVSDHGMSPSGGQSIDPNLEYQLWAGGFTVAKTEQEIIDRTDIVQIQHGSAFLYLRNGRFDSEREKFLLEHLRQIEGVEVLSRDALKQLGTDPELVGDLVVVPQDGYTLYPGSGSTGIHGRPQEQQITLIMAGAGIRKGVVLKEAEIIDVVPTLLHLFGLDIPKTVDGRVLTEALEDDAG